MSASPSRGGRKKSYQRAVRLNITIPSSLMPELDKILIRQNFSGPADYFQARVRLDAGLDLKPA
jgi:hypothetical protein